MASWPPQNKMFDFIIYSVCLYNRENCILGFFFLEYAFSYGGLDGKMSARNVGDRGSIPRSGRSPGEGNGNLFQYSCLEDSMDGGAWWATVHGVAKSQTHLSNLTHYAYTWISVYKGSLDFVCI